MAFFSLLLLMSPILLLIVAAVMLDTMIHRKCNTYYIGTILFIHAKPKRNDIVLFHTWVNNYPPVICTYLLLHILNHRNKLQHVSVVSRISTLNSKYWCIYVKGFSKIRFFNFSDLPYFRCDDLIQLLKKKTP